MAFKSKAQTPRENFNKQYEEWKMEVTTAMKPDGYGGEKLRYYDCEFIKRIKVVSIEPKRADQLNRNMHSRLVFYRLEGVLCKDIIRRTPVEHEDGEVTWHDKGGPLDS